MTDFNARSAVPDYQERIRTLIEENRALKCQLSQALAESRREISELKAELSEGLSPELLVLRTELRTWKERARIAEGRLAANARSRDGQR